MRRRLSLEFIVIAFCCIGLIATGSSLLFSSRSSQQGSGTKSVGSIRPVGRDIRVKGEADSAWNQVARDANVFRNDRVYTGKNSQAKVTLKNDERFTVEPNSLVVISDGENRQTIDFSTGGLLSELKKGAKLFVKFKGKETEISSDKNATIRLSSSKEGSLKLIVLKGEAEVKRGKEVPPEKVSANSELEVSKSDAKPIMSSITLTKPEPGEEKWTKTNAVSFAWGQSDAGPVTLEISTDPEFSTKIKSAQSDSTQMQLSLPASSTYFWRVVDQSHPAKKSLVSSFTLQELIAPTVDAFAEVEIETTPEGKNKEAMHFEWNDQLASDEYEFELSRDPGFSSLIESRRTVTTSSSISNLSVGKYFWRVRSLSRDRESLVSNTGELVLKEQQKLEILPIAQDSVPEISPIREIAQALDAQGDQKAENIHLGTPIEAVSETEKVPEEPKPVSPPPQVPAAKQKRVIRPKAPKPLAPKQTEHQSVDVIEEIKNTPEQIVVSETKPPDFWFWFGSGVNFQYYKQTIPSLEGQTTFNNIQGPTAVVSGGFQGETLGLDVSFKDTPGKMDSSATVDVSNGAYHWQILSVEGLYRTKNQWNARFGVQHHLMPFMALDAQTAIVDVKSNTLTMLTAGFDRNFPLTKDLRAEWMMRYQFPLLSGSSEGAPFEVTPRFAFDGSLGGVYSLDKRTRLGVYWYGQWHEYSFNYGRGSDSFSGEQTLFYSSIEMRLGFEF